ncbi:hypothetical protein [Vibrio fluvialis]|uniref:hypothetical protein n=1 Tax=Vibrio fluvialis TaxID=676 RepID=UPI001EEA5B82|nr:hypothetical protein [Vibrio fluvialis]MCG6350424.1 hypothetical protein [Vibrio fluvialis]
MGSYTIDEEYLDLIEKQFKKWAVFLNNAIGILAFTLSLACLGTNVPWLNACFSVLIVSYVWLQGRNHFPEEIEKLRKASKDDKQAKLVLKALLSEHLNWKTMFITYPVYWLGYVLLLVTALSPIFHRALVQMFGSADSFSFFFGL